MMDEACSGTTAKGKKRISLFLLHSVCSAVVEASRTAPDWLAPLAGFTCHELAGVAQHRRAQSWQCRPSLSLTASTSTQPGVYPRLSPSNQPPRTQSCGLRFVDSSDSPKTLESAGSRVCAHSAARPPGRGARERGRTGNCSSFVSISSAAICGLAWKVGTRGGDCTLQHHVHVHVPANNDNHIPPPLSSPPQTPQRLHQTVESWQQQLLVLSHGRRWRFPRANLTANC
ncbi:hypothetical protein HDK90DRAFT_334937 [Phyllosticta capitalensis]|uniref:Uncharacterized protein n=1 Tax=Phyllosticta capitalensis TaxID=121624 RepID=A0ABR1YJW9_9PEZI